MNTLQLKRALEHNPSTKKIFGGVFAADELPKTFDTLVVLDPYLARKSTRRAKSTRHAWI